MNAPEPITLLIVNGRVWTGDSRRPWAGGVGISGERISLVASSAEIAKLAAAYRSATVIDVHGAVVAPAAEGSIERGEQADIVIIDGEMPAVTRDVIAHSAVTQRIVRGVVLA